MVTSPKTRLERVIRQFKVYPQYPEDDVIDQDLILYWGEEKRIVTGSDILGRLLRGIVVECDLGSGCETPASSLKASKSSGEELLGEKREKKAKSKKKNNVKGNCVEKAVVEFHICLSLFITL